MPDSPQPTSDHSDPLARSGLVIVDKPAGMTSHDVVSRMRRLMRTRKVGHAGTLDPMATGVLIIGVERGTKFLAHMVADTKAYSATIRLGFSTSTDDREGDISPLFLTDDSATHIERLSESIPSGNNARGQSDDMPLPPEIQEGINRLTGAIMQRPSKVSAIKINGQRAYDLIRQGVEVDIPARPVEVSSFTVTDIRTTQASITLTSDEGSQTSKTINVIDLDVDVECSSGTYIRALARDLGEDLGVGGHLTMLRRTRVGAFGIEQSRTLDQLEQDKETAEESGTDDRAPLSLGLDDAIAQSFPVRPITAKEARDLALGKWLEPIGLEGTVAAVDPDGRAIALVTEKGKRAKSVFVARPATLTS